MITILIGMVVGLLIAIYKTYNGWMDGFVDYIVHSFIGVLLGLFIGLLVAIILPMTTEQKQYSSNIESLNDNNSINGSFFLGCGQIEGKMKYVFYYEEKGLYKMMQVDCEKASIKYTDSKPKATMIQKEPTKSMINEFAIDLDLYDKIYIIEVPKGTIKNNYNLDAQ